MRNEARIWNRFAGVYDKMMKGDMHAYDLIIQKISALLIPEYDVLEVATGTGIISLGIAECAKHIEAVDISGKMIAQARNKAREMHAGNIRFSVQDAYSLSFSNTAFDVAIIANSLHIMPHPETALAEIKRILKPNGILIVPTFIHGEGFKAFLFSRIASVTGFRAYHRWTLQTYCRFLEENGWTVQALEKLPASIPMAYCQCVPS